jgi:gamma-glutamylputrescine oxidase
MFSYWEKKELFERYQFAVIGGGIVGLSTAIYLAKAFPAKRIVVLERDAFSRGASSKNAGFSCFGSPSELLEDLKTLSPDEVFSLVERRYKGLLNLRSLLGDNGIGYEACGGFELFTQSEQSLYEECEAGLSFLNSEIRKIGIPTPYEVVDPASRSWPVVGVKNAIGQMSEGSIQTGRMLMNLQELARQHGVLVLNGVNVSAWKETGKGIVLTIQQEDFLFEKAVVCTNGFAKDLLPELDVRPARNQVIVTEKIEGLSMRGTFHMNKGYIYFREVDQRILLGGFRDVDMQNEFTDQLGLTSPIQEALSSFLRDVLYPERDLKIEYAWSGIMGLGPNKTTIVKQHSDHLFVGVRMGGMGVAIGSLVGKEVADLVLKS